MLDSRVILSGETTQLMLVGHWGKRVNKQITHSLAQSLNQSIDKHHHLNQSINKSMVANQSIVQSIRIPKWSINQSLLISQSISQWPMSHWNSQSSSQSASQQAMQDISFFHHVVPTILYGCPSVRFIFSQSVSQSELYDLVKFIPELASIQTYFISFLTHLSVGIQCNNTYGSTAKEGTTSKGQWTIWSN